MLKAVADDLPGDVNAIRNLAAVSHQLADAEWRLGHGTRARELHAEALRLRQERLKTVTAGGDEQTKADAALDVAESFAHVAYADLRLGDPEKAVENYHASDAAFANLPPPLTSWLKVRRTRAEIQVRLGDAQSRLKKDELAQKHYLDALDERETLLRSTQRPPSIVGLIKTDIGQSRMYLGDFLLFIRKDPQAAAIVYEMSLRDFLNVLTDEPDSLDLRQRVAAAHYRLGVTGIERPEAALIGGGGADAAMRSRHYAESLRLREELAKIDSKDMQGQVELLLSLARLGRTDDAERVATGMMKQAGTDPQVLFQMACGHAILANGTSETAKRNRDQAFRVMAKLIECGWKDRVGLETDPDFEAIRGDKRFAEIIARLEAKAEGS